MGILLFLFIINSGVASQEKQRRFENAVNQFRNTSRTESDLMGAVKKVHDKSVVVTQSTDVAGAEIAAEPGVAENEIIYLEKTSTHSKRQNTKKPTQKR